MKLTFTVDGDNQIIKRTDGNAPVADSVKFLTAEFTITGMTGMTCTPLFSNVKPPEYTQAGTDTITVTCDVPAEVIAYPGFDVSLFGKDSASDKRITVNSVPVLVTKSGYGNATDALTPSTTVYEQILTAIESKADSITYANNILSLMSGSKTLASVTITGGSSSGGKGIQSIAKTSTSGLVDTYTITYTDGTTSTYTVTNGNDGDPGTDGVSILKVEQTTTSTADGGTNVITVTLSDGTSANFTVKNGSKGSTGKGIESIVKTATSGLIDTYTITYTDKTTSTFTVSNGSAGSPGTDGTAATIAVGTVTTGAAGTSASVSNKGTATAAVLDFVIPAGAAGADGKDMTAQGETVTDTGAVTKALTANKFCNFTGAIKTLTITLPTTYNPWDEFNFCFTTDSTGGNLALPATVTWLSGSAPSLAASTYYEVSICNNKGVIAP